jgi:hypothetical protein
LPHSSGVDRIKVPIEVATLTAKPLLLALDGDAVVLTRAMALKFGPQIHRRETCYAY